MAESAESKSIKELTNTIIDENEKARALQERIAAGTRENGQFASKAEIDAAKESIKKQEESNITQKKLLGVNDAVLAKIQINGDAIDKQKEIMDAQRKELEDLGIDADNDKNFKKEQVKLAKMELEQAKLTGSKDAEKAAKDKIGDNKMLGYLKKTAGFLGGIAKQGMEKVKSGLQGFSKFAFGALAIAALSFLNSPQFDKYYDQIVNVIVPALTYIYEKVIVPMATFIKEKLLKLFEDIKGYIDGDKSLFSVLMENKLAIIGIIAALAPGLSWGIVAVTAGLLKKAVLAFGGAMKKSYLAQLATNAAAGGGKAGVLGTLKALGSTFLRFTGIAALIYGAVVGIFQGAKDAYAEFKKTGSVWESVKTFLQSFVANFLGAILDPIKAGVSWIFGWLGRTFGISAFKKAEKFLDSFSVVEVVKKFLGKLSTFISEFVDGLVDGLQNMIRSITIFGVRVGDKVADKLFGTKQEQSDAKIAKEMAREMEQADADIGLSPVGGQTKKIKQLSADIAKQQNQNQGAINVVDNKSFNTSNMSPGAMGGSVPMRNSNPFISAYANSSDFPF